MKNMRNKSVLVTGANGGMGLLTCKALAGLGVERLVMACRTEAKADVARDELLDTVDVAPGRIEVAHGFDMLDVDGIRSAVDRLPANKPFDVVFLQSGGVIYGDAWKTVSYRGKSIERTIFQNVLGAHVTLSQLVARGLVAPGARVVFAGGEGARGVPGLMPKPNFDGPEALRRYVEVADPGATYHEMHAMGASKFMGALWTQKVADLYGDAFSTVWFTPGLTAGTKGLAGVGAVKQWVFENIAFPMMVLLGKAQTAQAGADKFVRCLTGEIGENGDLIGAPEGGALGELQDQKPMNDALTRVDLRDELWNVFADMVGPFGAKQHALHAVEAA